MCTLHRYTQDSNTYNIHTYTTNSCSGTHTPLVSLVQSPLQKPLSHRNQRARKGIKAVYIMKLKELLHAVSLTTPRKAFLLLQRIEERKKEEKKKKIPRTMQHNNSGNNSKAYSKRERLQK